MAKVRVVVSVSNEFLSRLDSVVETVEAVGMEVVQRLSGIGVLSGTINRQSLDALRRVEGVAHVEEERQVGPL